jgi:hypothetical protein
MSRWLLPLATHAATLAVGLGVGAALGIYWLPILTAPTPPASITLASADAEALYRGRFRRDLKDSDWLHWGEGEVLVGARSIALRGRLAPGPDYKLYLSPAFVETEADFLRHKPSMRRLGDVKTFENFVVPVPEGLDVNRYTTVVVWCETFGKFITAARYRSAE